MKQLSLIAPTIGDEVVWNTDGRKAKVIAIFENPHLGGRPQKAMENLYHMSPGAHEATMEHSEMAFTYASGLVVEETLYLIQGVSFWTWAPLEELS